MDTEKRVQNLDEAVCISHRTKPFRKGFNSIILPSYRPIIGKTMLFNLGTDNNLAEGKHWNQTC